MNTRDEILRELALRTPYSRTDWEQAANLLGPRFGKLYPQVETLVAIAGYSPLYAAQRIADLIIDGRP